MRIEDSQPDRANGSWCFICAALLIAQIFSLGSLPFEPFEPWNKLFHVLAFSALALMLWIATDGRRPVLVIVGVMMLGAMDEFRQAAIPSRSADVFDFLADALAAGVTGVVLMWTTKPGAKKPCAESSQQ
jgi:VanZ family protein